MRGASTYLRCYRLRPPLPSQATHGFAKTLSVSTATTEVRRPPSSAPKPMIDTRHIREHAKLHETNCNERNYRSLSSYPARVVELFGQWQTLQRNGRVLRERSSALRKQLATAATSKGDAPVDDRGTSREQLLDEARQFKQELSGIEQDEARLEQEIQALAVAIPNLTSEQTPRGGEPLLLDYINTHPEQPLATLSEDRVRRSHIHIGSELGLLDFAGAATASGWGWYYLLGDAARLEQALVQYALSVATHRGWHQTSPPTVVYSHIAAACGFQPRDQHGEQQIYTLSQADRGKPELCLAGTSEIPLAGMKANTTMRAQELPMKRVAVSRCYRAEAGARGADTKGLYRVHEFTKVEMFAWTPPGPAAALEVFNEILAIQTEILGSLGLHCRVLEMPSTDLGASATRKCDIEAFFPSRRKKNDGWGEVTSASICTDYQSRRLATRVKVDGKLAFPWTVNGTALAVPRVLAALLENGWDETRMSVAIPECLRPWMGGKHEIRRHVQ